MNSNLSLALAGGSRSALPQRLWTDLIGLLVTLLALVVSYKLGTAQPVDRYTRLPEDACNLQSEACRIVLPDGSQLTLQAPTAPIAPNQPLIVEAGGLAAATELIGIEVRATSVATGSNKAEFSPAENGRFRAMTSLPLCTSNATTWQLDLLFASGGRQYRLPMAFSTVSTLHGTTG